MPYISQNKIKFEIWKMKFGQLIECNKRNIALQESYRKWGKRLVPDLFLFYKKKFIWGKSK